MKITFPMPEGFTLPEGGDQGPFEVLATLQVEDGELSLMAIDGIPLGEAEPEEEDNSEYDMATDPNTGDFQKAVAMGMSR